MKEQIKTPVLVAVLVVFVGGIVYWGFQSLNSAGSLDHGQIKYTPGKPPWMTKGETQGGGPAMGAPGGAPTIDNRPH